VFLTESVTWNVPVGEVARKRQEVRGLPLEQKAAQQS
jgi:hypothetical protein